MEERITSRRNPLLAHTKKLLTSRSYREKMGEFAADGVKLLAEAARWYPGLTTVIAEDGIELCKLPEQTRVVRVPKDVMQSISLMDAPQGAIFLCRLPEAAPAALVPGTLLLDGIQDPGNLGTIIRSSEGAGVSGIIMSKDTVDIYNPKTIRSTMGALFRMPFVYAENFQEVLNSLNCRGFNTCSACLDGAVDYCTIDYSSATAIIIGNEGNGLTRDTIENSKSGIKIPMSGGLESLNAAVSTAIIAYEARRQRNM